MHGLRERILSVANPGSSQDTSLRGGSTQVSHLSAQFQPEVQPEDPPADSHRHQAQAVAGDSRQTGDLASQANLLSQAPGQQRSGRGRRTYRRGRDGGAEVQEDPDFISENKKRSRAGEQELGAKAREVSQLQYRRADQEIVCVTVTIS